MKESMLTKIIVLLKGRPSSDTLETSIRHGSKSGLRKLVFLGADLNAPLKNGDLPLHLAVGLSKKDMVQFFLEKEADVNLRNQAGETALHIAAETGNSELTSLLLKRGDAMSRDKKGATPFKRAVVSGSMETAGILLKAAPQALNDHQNEQKIAPLHEAVKTGNLKMIDFLLENGADINLKSLDGTAFYWASCFGDMKVAEHLLERGADPLIAGKGGYPVFLTATFGRDVIFEKILTKYPSLVQFKDEATGETLLHIAVKNTNLKIVNLLVSRGADVNAISLDGKTPLHLASMHGHKEYSEILIMKGAAIDPKSSDGMTPLLLACMNGHKEIAELLILRHADLNLRTSDGMTPLLYAVKANKIKLVKILVEKGANPDLADNRGNKPLFHSIVNNFKDITDYLEKVTKDEGKNSSGMDYAKA